MSGYPALNADAFRAAAEELRADGYDVVSPLEIDGDTTISWPEALIRDIKLLEGDVQIVFVLPGWQQSRGALLELTAATILGIPIMEADTRRYVFKSEVLAALAVWRPR